jgi:ABC-type antimicrobial peptide transport system permease subunit
MVVSRLDRLTERSKVASRNVLDLLFDFLLSIPYILLASVLSTASKSNATWCTRRYKDTE